MQTRIVLKFKIERGECWLTSVIPALEWLSQKNCGFQASLDCTVGSRPVWTAQWVPGQLGLQNETWSKTHKIERQVGQTMLIILTLQREREEGYPRWTMYGDPVSKHHQTKTEVMRKFLKTRV